MITHLCALATCCVILKLHMLLAERFYIQIENEPLRQMRCHGWCEEEPLTWTLSDAPPAHIRKTTNKTKHNTNPTN
jgi:hypothetical protein